MDLKIDNDLEEIVVMNLNRSFHWNPLDIACSMGAEVLGPEF